MWAIKYRPLRYADVLGQDGNVLLLKTRIRNKSAFDTSYIFAGGHGQGKTTLGRIHARAMICQNLDLKDPEPCNTCDNCRAILDEQSPFYTERDAASNGRVEQMRELMETLQYTLEHKRISLFDEAQQLTPAAQDVLLKPLEDKRMVGMFCTTEVHKIRPAIRSRCEEYTIRPVTREVVLGKMCEVLNLEGVQYDESAVLIVIDHTHGHVRDALNTLEMVAQLGAVTVDLVRDYLRLSNVESYYQILLSLDNPAQSVPLVEKLCRELTPIEVAGGLTEAAMNTFRMLINVPTDLSAVDPSILKRVSDKYGQQVFRFVKWFGDSEYLSATSLIRDVVAFSMTSGNLPAEVPLPPVMFTSSVPAHTTAAPAPPPVTQPASAAKTTTVAATKTTTVPPPLPPAPVSKPTYAADPTPPGSQAEIMAVSRPQPRQRSNDTAAPVLLRNRAGTILNPSEWREKFERQYKKKVPV